MNLEETSFLISDSDFLVYIDESGNESLSDPNLPLFILGGCAVVGAQYSEAIDVPWRDLKEKYFDGADKPLHASNLDMSNKQGIEAIGKFFRDYPFHRFATAITKDTIIENKDTDIYVNTAMSALHMLSPFPITPLCERVAIIVESSTRGEPQAREHINNLNVQIHSSQGIIHPKVEYYFMPKYLAHPGMEVADFVVHAACRQTLANIKGRPGYGKDYQAVFQSKLPCIRFYQQLSRIKLTKK